MSEIKILDIQLLEFNKGQIEGLPKNPRMIRDARFDALKKSIQDAPEMLNLRELIVYPIKGQSKIKYVVICGNMRLKALKDLNYMAIPCKILDSETPPEKLREYAIKDNVAFGEIDTELLIEWDVTELQEWGMELPGWNINEPDDIKEIADFNETLDFRITCKDLDEMETLQHVLDTTGKKMKFDVFREKYESRNS